MQNKDQKSGLLNIGHITAIITIIIWGTTFISTKLLLIDFTPIEILFIRFLIGYASLWIFRPKPLRLTDKKQNLLFAAAGLTGITLYYLMENIALTYTLATNVGIIISLSPFFTALLDWLILKGERPSPRFIIGFVLAMAGIVLISGASSFEFNPLGDILSVGAAFMWAIYSIIMKKINELGYNAIESTRRIFFFGLVLMIPAIIIMGFDVGLSELAKGLNIGNILYLGVGASAACFATWTFTVGKLGPVKASVYIYAVPVITAITAAIVLNEPITCVTVLGMALTIGGLLLSESKKLKRQGGESPEMYGVAEES